MRCVVLGGPHAWTREAFHECARRYLGAELHRWIWCEHPEQITAYAPTWVFVLHWSGKVPDEIVRAWRCINFHMTDVPYGRGGTPLQNLILRGHQNTVLSAIRMTEGWDDGHVYGKRKLSLEGTAEEIYQRTMQLAVEMIGLILTDSVTPTAQTGDVTIFKRRTPEQSCISGAGSISTLYDHLRMLDADGYPRAFLEHQGRRYTFRHPAMTPAGIHAEVDIT